jgi:hypothetical protein
MTCEQVCVVNVDEENNEGVCDDVLDMKKIITHFLYLRTTSFAGVLSSTDWPSRFHMI